MLGTQQRPVGGKAELRRNLAVVDQAMLMLSQAACRRVTAHEAGGRYIELSARVLISAGGVLNRRKLPGIAGLQSFAGPAFQTAQWNKHFDWRGKRVAMIGSGASGHQVGPTIAPDVAHLTIFQRSPHWVVPNPNYHAGVNEGKK